MHCQTFQVTKTKLIRSVNIVNDDIIVLWDDTFFEPAVVEITVESTVEITLIKFWLCLLINQWPWVWS